VSMASMTPIKASEFNSEHLKLSNVWTWQGDLYQTEDSLIPVPLTEEALTQADSLLIHSKFKTSSGTELGGLVVYQLGDDEIFAIEILAGNQRFTFNKHLSDLSQEDLNRLATYLNEKVDHLLPIQYSLVPRELAIEDGEFTF
jgi:hypothetical protein